MVMDTEADRDSDLADIDEGDVLCDRRRQNCFIVSGVEDDGIALRNEDTEYYVPPTLFVGWYGSRVFPVESSESVDLPNWI
jgi:hypothetical protein